jgi:hypothetical protein
MAFDTIPQVYEGEMKHISLWQLKAGFLTSKKTLRATKLKEHASKAKQPETVTPPTTHNKFKTYLSRQREIHHQSRELQRLIRALLYLEVRFMNMTTHEVWECV